jgi:hypothetical protein
MVHEMTAIGQFRRYLDECIERGEVGSKAGVRLRDFIELCDRELTRARDRIYDERERCAKIADAVAASCGAGYGGAILSAEIAAAIRKGN